MGQGHRCHNCMNMVDDEGICPACGHANGEAREEYRNLLPPGTKLGSRYLIGNPLGSGGFGNTYIGYDLAGNRKVAVKEYMPLELVNRMPPDNGLRPVNTVSGALFKEGRKKTLEEGFILRSFRHVPGIVEVLDSFEENNTAYLVMEYLDGIPLSRLIQDKGKLSEKQALDIVMAILSALRAVHRHHLLHRDISPENIIMTRDGGIKLIDFGSSRTFDNVIGNTRTIMVKQGYAPPEQYSRKGNQGAWTDLYALACTFYKMVTGLTPPDSLDRLMGDKPQPLSGPGVLVSLPVAQVMEKAMRLPIAERYATAEEMESHLLRAVASVSRKKKARMAWAASLTLAAACIAMLVLLAGRQQEDLGLATLDPADRMAEEDMIPPGELPEVEPVVLVFPFHSPPSQDEMEELEALAYDTAPVEETVPDPPVEAVVPVPTPAPPVELPQEQPASSGNTATGTTFSMFNTRYVNDPVNQQVLVILEVPFFLREPEYSLNGGPWQTYTEPFILTHDADGDFRAKRENGEYFLSWFSVKMPLQPYAQSQGSLVPDPYLHAEIRRLLDKPEGELTREDLLRITRIQFPWAPQVADLTGLEHCLNLEFFALSNGLVSDISPLSGLPGLKYVFMSYNTIFDVSPLSENHSLISLDLVGNMIQDITPLAGLIRLEQLWMDNNLLRDISIVKNMPNLRELGVGSNRLLTDITPLMGLTSLTGLSIEQLNLYDISFLSVMTRMQSLHISYNPISDISALGKMPLLNQLTMTYTLVKDFSVLAGLSELTRLEIDGDNDYNDFEYIPR